MDMDKGDGEGKEDKGRGKERLIKAIAAMAAVKALFGSCKSSKSGTDATDAAKKGNGDKNPLDIDLILDLVMDKIDNKDRLKCRTINKRWFKMLSEKLQEDSMKEEENKWTIIINTETIQEYVEFVRKLDPEMRQSLLNLNVVIGGTHIYEQAAYDNLLQGLSELIELRGRKFAPSIAVLITRGEVDPNWEKVFWLIKGLAPGLRSLSIEDCTKRTDLSGMKKFFKIHRPGGWGCVLPELKSFTYGAMLKNHIILPQIIAAAPFLEKLFIPIRRQEARMNPSYMDRSSVIATVLETIAMRPNHLPFVREFTVPVDREETFKALMLLKLPQLEKLKLMPRRTITDEAGQMFANFLPTCPNLTSLEYDFHSFQEDYGLAGFTFPHGEGFARFPPVIEELPNITHLGWRAEQTATFILIPRSTGIMIDNFNQLCFPNLNTVTIQAGTFLYLDSYFNNNNPDAAAGHVRDNPAAFNNLNFPTVSRLNFVLDLIPEKSSVAFPFVHILYLDTCCQIHHLLPNLKHLFIDNQVTPLLKCHEKMKFMMKILLEHLPGVETLEISNYFQDWLNEFMDSSPAVVTNLGGVKTLIIPGITKCFKDILLSRGASIGIRNSSEYRELFEKRLMDAATIQFPPDEPHPWDAGYQNMLAGGLHAHVPAVQIFVANQMGQDDFINFDFLGPVVLEIGLVVPIGGDNNNEVFINGNAFNINIFEQLQDPNDEDPLVGGQLMVVQDLVAELALNAAPPPPAVVPPEQGQAAAPAPAPGAIRPMFHRMLLREIQRAVAAYPLPEIVFFTQPRLNVRKLVRYLPALERLRVNGKFLIDSVGLFGPEDRAKMWNGAFPKLSIEIIK